MRLRNNPAVIAIYVVVLCLTVPLFAATCEPDPPFKVHQFCGKVVDQTGVSLVAANIELQQKGQQEIRKLRTDLNGEFQIEKLPAGHYELRVKRAGLADLQQDFELTHPVTEQLCKPPIRVVMKPSGHCSYVENALKGKKKK